MVRWRCSISIALLFIDFDIFADDGSGNPLLSVDRVFRIGGQRADADVRAGLANPEIGEFPLIDLQGQGTDTTVTSFWTNVLWQAPARWSVGFSYFEAEADARRITDSDITFGF